MFQVDISNYFKNRYKEIKNIDEKNKIFNWIAKVEQYGLFKYPKLAIPGKIAPSWSNAKEPHYSYAQQYNLWHYHIGHENYEQGEGDYLKSNWMVHFIWDKRNRNSCFTIKLVDYTPHKVLDKFPIPQDFKFK